MSVEIGRLFRFGVIGFLVAVVYVTLYTAFVHFGVEPLTGNTVAYMLAVLVQYVGQTLWTFRRALWDGQQSFRFGVTIGIGLIYSGILAGEIGPMLGWQPWVSAGLVAVTLPVLNYVSFKLWVYRADPREGSNP
ncbi:MAG: GtrA family protein [Pseudomonadota bacterium]